MSSVVVNDPQSDCLPDGFVYLDERVPQARVELCYFCADNFIGERVDGYQANRGILTNVAASALQKAVRELQTSGFGVRVFDAYRPQQAVDQFIRWSEQLQNTASKSRFYPQFDKKELFLQGYLAERSSHSRGSTLDLTIVSLATGEALDMGSEFDFFGPESWPSYTGIDEVQRANRLLLRGVMTNHGFEPYPQEWWHFTLRDEPYPDTYFDFVIQ